MYFQKKLQQVKKLLVVKVPEQFKTIFAAGMF
jgi:hypothetical protein